MTDLLDALPDFNVKPYSHLFHSLEKNHITISDLITFDPVEIAKACPLPLGDVRDLVRDVAQALQKDVGISNVMSSTSIELLATGDSGLSNASRHLMTNALKEPGIVKTQDPVIDAALGGGFHTGCITEIAGERYTPQAIFEPFTHLTTSSAAGKTQFVLGLLLTVQLPPPHGLGRNAIYISTEAPLSTTRLKQMIASSLAYTELSRLGVPSFDKIYSIPVNDLEAQEHIIEYQLPIAVKKYNVGLVVMDSVAANFRAEYETRTLEGLSERAKDLAKLGKMFRKIAIEHNLAVIVTNQVSDRFDEPGARINQDLLRSSSPAFSSPPAPPPLSAIQKQAPNAPMPTRRDEIMSLDHQQCFFTGWGNERGARFGELKTPALGLAWTNQIAARIVLKVESERAMARPEGYLGGHIWRDRKRRRFMNVVFAPWVEPTAVPVEYEIKAEGVVAVTEALQEEKDDKQRGDNEDTELLDEKLWGFNGVEEEDEEFP